MSFDRLNLGTRLGLDFFLVTLAGLLVALFGSWRIASLGKDLDLVVNDRVAKAMQVNQIKANNNMVAQSLRNILLLPLHSERLAEEQRVKELLAKNSALIADLEAKLTTGRGKDLMRQLQAQRTPYVEKVRQTMDLAMQGEMDLAHVSLFNQLRPLQENY